MRAAVKGAIQAAFGWTPGGPQCYRMLTRRMMGTQATHIDKMTHVWPDYLEVWRNAGIELEGLDIWMHGGAWTIYPCLLCYLTTGKGCWMTDEESGPDEQYTAKSIEFALNLDLPGFAIPPERRSSLHSLRGKTSSEILTATEGAFRKANRVAPQYPPGGAGLLLSGGVLEHLRPADLDRFLAHSYQGLRPGGWCSHVFDLRDHLYHSDKTIPFLNHLRLSPTAYAIRHGHPLGYHSRLLPSEIVKKFERAGFQVHLVRRHILPSRSWIKEAEPLTGALLGLDRSLLHSSFDQATDKDLHTAALHILARRPI